MSTEPTVEVTRYQVSCLPSDDPDAYHFTLTVERRDVNPDRWAVMRGSFCLDAKGREEYEPNPSSRTDAFKRRYRHSLEDALALAKRIAPTLTVMGHTVDDALARRNAE